MHRINRTLTCVTLGLACTLLGACCQKQGTLANGILVPNERTPKEWRGPQLSGAMHRPDGNGNKNKYIAEATLNEISPVIQRSSVWCWAACAEMVQRYYGVDITQEEIVNRVKNAFGEQTSQPVIEAATKREIMLALNPDLKLYFAKLGGAKAIELLLQRRLASGDLDVSELINARWKYSKNNSDLLIASLLQGDPAIIVLKWADEELGTEASDAAMAHAYVVKGVTFSQLEVNRGLSALIHKAIQKGQSVIHGEMSKESGKYIDVRKINYPDDPACYALVDATLINPLAGQIETVSGPEIQERIVYFFTRDSAREILFLEAKALNLELPPELMEAMEMAEFSGS